MAEETIQENKEVDTLKRTISEQKLQLEEQDDRLKRLLAEFDNFKKRSTKEKTNQYESLLGDIITSFLPVIDNLEKARSVETEDTQYKEGIQMVVNQFVEVLKSLGVEQIEAQGKPFDPELHEAVSSVQDDALGIQIVKEEYRKGYKIGNRVIRHSIVVVAN